MLFVRKLLRHHQILQGELRVAHQQHQGVLRDEMNFAEARHHEIGRDEVQHAESRYNQLFVEAQGQTRRGVDEQIQQLISQHQIELQKRDQALT